MKDINQIIHAEWKNLATDLIRQRTIIEATTPKLITPKPMRKYLVELATVADMQIINGPYIYSAHELGYGGWIHWRTSGTHIYSYRTKPLPLITIDIYSCKCYDTKKVVEFTKDFFKAKEIVWKDIEI